MDAEVTQSWNTGEKSGLVNIGSHKLWLSTRGPDCKTGEPLVIIIPGLASNTTGWAAVHRGLVSFTRVLQYERSGYGRSECSIEKPTASTIAKELNLLLRSANLPPPYVIVAHSWGGILSREILALRPTEIAGMIFVDANQERTLEVLDWRQLAFSDMLVGINSSDATGLSRDHKLSSDEWRIYQATQATEQHQRQAGLEFAEYPNSFPTLSAKSQLCKDPPLLGDKPVCVIKGDNRADFEKLLNAGLARGNGNKVKQDIYKKILDTWDEKDKVLQSEILKLSTNSRYVEAKNSGHNIHLTEPQIIVDSVKWILSEAHKSIEL